MRPEQIKDVREKLGLTQAELAKSFGVSRLTISQYEIGFRRPGSTALVLLRVLDAFSRVRALELVELLRLHGDEERPKPKRRRA